VEWDTLQQEEVAALVDWVLQMPPEWPLTPLLKDRALQAVAAQISGHHQRCARALTGAFGCGSLTEGVAGLSQKQAGVA
jgi:hypothetical protein